MLDIGITRPTEGRVIAGVCAGLAVRFGIDPIVPRIVFAASMLFGGAGGLIYVLLWVLMPNEK